MVKVSVVIPVYNVEEFLNECLDSIIHQTLEDIEIICVNDGSTDNSLDIINFYAKNDNRIIVISQENSGHAVATNLGMNHANGEYLYLMDSDDILKLTALEETYNYAKKKNADFILFQSLNYDTNKNKYYESEIYNMDYIADLVGDTVFNYNDLGDMIFDIPVTPWSKLYKNQFIKDIGVKFPEGLVFDDNIFFWDVLFNAKRIAFYRKHLFIRRWYDNSSTTSGDLRFLDSIDILNMMIDQFKKYNLLEKYHKKVFNKKVKMTYFRFTTIKPEFENAYFEKLHEDFKKCIDDGIYSKYMEKSLDDRNKTIFDSCINSKTAKEFKYRMAYYDEIETRKKLENEKIESYKTLNILKNQLKELEDENHKLKNNNIKLNNQISSILSSKIWKLITPLNKLNSSKRSFKIVSFNILHFVVSFTDSIKINNFKVINYSNKEVKIDYDKLIVIYDEVNALNFNELTDNNDFFSFSASIIGRGEHKICIKYDDTLSEEYSIFIKDSNNLFDFNVWLGTYNTKDTFGFDKIQIESISSSDDWSDIGDRSIKVVCNGKNNFQALMTPKMRVNVGDFISAYVTIFNPEEEVEIRLLESSNDTYEKIMIGASNKSTRVNISKTACSKSIQLIIVSSKKQTFYADNFVFTKN